MGPYAGDYGMWLLSRNMRVLANRLGWPDDVAPALIRLAHDYPRMVTWWHGGTGYASPSEICGAGYYSYHREARLRMRLPYYGATETLLRVALLDEENAQAEIFPHYQPLMGNGDT